jgi:hypothetical protein
MQQMSLIANMDIRDVDTTLRCLSSLGFLSKRRKGTTDNILGLYRVKEKLEHIELNGSQELGEYGDVYIELAQLFYKRLLSRFKYRGVQYNDSTWPNEMRKIHIIDGHSISLIRSVIFFTFDDDFWRDTVMSPASLRRNFNTILGQLERKASKEDQLRKQRATQIDSKIKDLL